MGPNFVCVSTLHKFWSGIVFDKIIKWSNLIIHYDWNIKLKNESWIDFFGFPEITIDQVHKYVCTLNRGSS